MDSIFNALNSWRENSENGFAGDSINETFTTGISIQTKIKGKTITRQEKYKIF